MALDRIKDEFTAWSRLATIYHSKLWPNLQLGSECAETTAKYCNPLGNQPQSDASLSDDQRDN